MLFQRPLLTVSTDFARIQITAPLGEYNIRSPKASMDRSVQKSELSVSTDPLKLNVDHAETSASLGYYNLAQKKQKVVSESKQAVLKAIGEASQNGDKMMKSQGKAFADICQSRFLKGPYRLEQTFIPARPTITWTGTGETKTEFTQYKQDITWDVPLKAEVEYQRRNPEISMAKWHKVDITYNGTPADVTKIGRETAQKLFILL